MNFPYSKVLDFPKHQKRERILPWIRFGIYNPKEPKNIIYPIGLVDSGSDVTFITSELGEELGYEIRKGVKDELFGVGGGKIDIWFHKVGIILEELKGKEAIKFEDQIAFSFVSFPQSMPQQTAILGTIGFFRHVSVSFSYPVKISINQ